MLKIIDNYLSVREFEKIRSLIVDNSSFPWFYSSKIAYFDEDKNLDKFQFFHLFYIEEKGVCSDYYEKLFPLIEKLSAVKILRIKANLGTRTNSHIEGGYHVDSNNIHKTAILYLNNNNGFTKFEDGTVVQSVENRIVIFDSNLKHTGVSQTDSKTRCVLNINYIDGSENE